MIMNCKDYGDPIADNSLCTCWKNFRVFGEILVIWSKFWGFLRILIKNQQNRLAKIQNGLIPDVRRDCQIF